MQCFVPRTSLFIISISDTESARASRKQYREAVFSVLFDMNVPAICAIDQVTIQRVYLLTWAAPAKFLKKRGDIC